MQHLVLIMCKAITNLNQMEDKVNRKELVAEIAERAELEKKKSDEVLQHIVEIIMQSVAKGETIAIPGFAKFARVDRKARMGRNPATGETIKIKASRKAKKAPAKKAPAKKAVAKKAPAKKAPARKTAAKKTTAKKRQFIALKYNV